MCIVTYFKHLQCNHIWAVVTEPCLPYMGFSNCPSFAGPSVVVNPVTGNHVGNIRGGRLKARPKFYKTKTRLCPQCDLKGAYNPNVARLVRDMGWGFTWGKDAADPEASWGLQLIVVYEPAEDSFLLLDTLSSPTECAFLTNRFAHPAPLIVEIGTGSGVVLGFVNAQCQTIFGKSEILTAGIDMNAYACRATVATVKRAAADEQASTTQRSGTYLGSSMADLTSCFRPGAVDVLIFNPPYVPTSEMPVQPDTFSPEVPAPAAVDPSFDDDSYLLALSYAGGADGMETTDRLFLDLARILSARGCAYVLLCAQNKPDLVKMKIPEQLGKGWKAQTVGSSGKTAGWEKLQVLRIWNEAVL
ncbi:hypothetical protein MY10362_006914 [Beauveria mimosiformis]